MLPGTQYEAEHVIDLVQPKRRRFHSPPDPGPSRNQLKRKRDEDNDEDDADADDGEEDVVEIDVASLKRRRENESTAQDAFKRSQDWSQAAGVYKDTNVLLHDLHAEQRHRHLFPCGPHTSNMQYNSVIQQIQQNPRNDHDTKAHFYPHLHPIGTELIPHSKDDIPLNVSRPDDPHFSYVSGEATIVSQRYEHSNR